MIAQDKWGIKMATLCLPGLHWQEGQWRQNLHLRNLINVTPKLREKANNETYDTYDLLMRHFQTLHHCRLRNFSLTIFTPFPNLAFCEYPRYDYDRGLSRRSFGGTVLYKRSIKSWFSQSGPCCCHHPARWPCALSGDISFHVDFEVRPPFCPFVNRLQWWRFTAVNRLVDFFSTSSLRFADSNEVPNSVKNQFLHSERELFSGLGRWTGSPSSWKLRIRCEGLRVSWIVLRIDRKSVV